MGVNDSRDSRNWTPRAGVSKTPLMHFAYHIKDDRYDHISEKGPRKVATDKVLAQDEYDSHDWLVSMRRSRDRFPSISLSSENLVNEYMSPMPESRFRPSLPGISKDDRGAVVGVNDQGNVYISWLSHEHRSQYVNIGAVMNRGTYSVTEFCPVSKALSLVAKLGLRHLVVLGARGHGGDNQVVGIVTRINLLPQSIKDKTGLHL
jgi:hypothetical protein